MNRKRLSLLICLPAALLSVFASSCEKKTLFAEYEDVKSAVWESGDAKYFFPPAITEDGEYDISLLLRADRSFPFMNITVAVDETIFPSNENHTNLVCCPLFDKKGNATGKGINLFQYSCPIETRKLSRGDSLVIVVKHGMRREMLPGITNAGIKIEKR